MAEKYDKRRLAAILASDVVGYSRMMREDESGTLEALQALQRATIVPEIEAHHGRVVKLMGDGLLAAFPSAVSAVDCAIAIQRRLAGAERGLRLRIGVNIGDVIVDDADVFGDSVNVAARLESLAAPGGVCISAAVHECIGERAAVDFEAAGERRVKNIDRPIGVWRWPATGEGPAEETEEALHGRVKPRVALSRFKVISTDADHDVIADGLDEELATALAKIDAINVVSSAAARTSPRAGGEPGEAPLADFVIEGSVQAAGGRLRVAVRLTDGATGEPIWAERIEGGADDVFSLQDSVSQQIVMALEVRLSDGQQILLWRKEAADPVAYEAFLTGRSAYAEYSRHSNTRARRKYEEALARSPRFISAMAGLARTYIEDASYMWGDDPVASLAKANELLDGAFALDPDHALANAERAHALLVAGDFEAALEAGRKAVRTDPSLADALHVLATVLSSLERHEEALRLIRECLRLNPRQPDFYEATLADALIGLKRFEQALPVLRGIVGRKPNWLMTRAMLAIALQATGRAAEATDAVRRIGELSGRFSISRWRRLIYSPDRSDVPEMAELLRASGLPD